MEKGEVMRLAGLGETAYEYARKLRDAIVTSELREAAQELLGSAA
jgi:hypothetical protein